MKKLFKYPFYIILIILFSCSSNEEDFTNNLVASIVVTGNDISDGDTSQMQAEIFPVTAINKAITWSVSDETIATISSSGLLRAVSNGSVIVSAESKDDTGVIGTKEITVAGVVAPPVFVESITISGSD